MKAVVFRDGQARVVDRPDPSPAPGEAIVRVAAAGICGTDLEIGGGYMEFDGVPGHEFVGVVASSPDPSWVGRRVVGEINASCGACPACAAGLGRHCPRRTVLGILGRDGAFAERLALPLGNLHEVPEGVPDEAAVFCEPLAAAWEIAEQVTIGAGTSVALLGDGRLAQMCARVLHRLGAPPAVFGRHAGKLLRLAPYARSTSTSAPAGEERFDVVVEATGSPEALAHAIALARPRGTVVLKSTYRGSASIALAPLVIDEISIVGSRCGRFAPALAHLASDPASFASLVDARYPLRDASIALASASSSGVVKVLLVP